MYLIREGEIGAPENFYKKYLEEKGENILDIQIRLVTPCSQFWKPGSRETDPPLREEWVIPTYYGDTESYGRTIQNACQV